MFYILSKDSRICMCSGGQVDKPYKYQAHHGETFKEIELNIYIMCFIS